MGKFSLLALQVDGKFQTVGWCKAQPHKVPRSWGEFLCQREVLVKMLVYQYLDPNPDDLQ
jgi:hypothetical protein